MNCIELFLRQSRERARQPALRMPGKAPVSFEELRDTAAGFQALCRRSGVGPGHGVLLFEGIGPRLYGAVLGILALGASVVLLEPWMKRDSIRRILETVKPRLFLAGSLGRLWGLRVPAVRALPAWAATRAAARDTGSRDFVVESVDRDTPGVLVFTSGTSGHPKGIARSHGFLAHEHELLTRRLGLERFRGPDLSIFANFVLSNLASGRCSVIVPHRWKASHLRELDALPACLQPETAACGPAFLGRLVSLAHLRSLKAAYVGGALTDCGTLEAAFRRWPETAWTLVYGSSEAEPVSTADARQAAALSRQRGFVQTLFVGRPIPEIRYALEAESLWVSGDHVCPRYIANEEANRRYKRTDLQGRSWHFMGDRIREEAGGWWFAGRSEQALEDFELEQAVYGLTGSSSAFVFRDAQNRACLLGEGLRKHEERIRGRHREIHRIVHARVYRDRRHRAKIDRVKSVRKGAPWNAG